MSAGDTVCGYCSTGCGLRVDAGRLTPSPGYPVNRGMACPKGWEALAPLGAEDRALEPLIRNRRGKLTPVSWSKALRHMVDGLTDVQRRHGPESVAFLGSGQLPTEELALLGALAKFGIGMRHGDGNTRQCMATAVAAYNQSFGFDAPPYCYRDFEESDVIVLWGSNLCVAHPILWERICRNRRNPTIIAIDPRMTETAAASGLHLPLRPKSDLALAYGIARILIDRGAIDRNFIEAHTSGFDEFARHAGAFPLDRVAHETDLRPNAIEQLASAIAGADRVSFWWTMGVNQSHQGVRTAQAIINLALMTGNIGRPGTGANSITGQCNAMGSRLFSNTSSLLGGRDFEDPTHRTEVAGALGIDLARIPTEASWAYDRILEGVLRGRIKALWIVATNTAHSWINQCDLDTIFDRLDLLVVQDMYATTATARRADIVLPAAGWGEKDGTFINSERRIARVRAVARPPGDAATDFAIFKRVAQSWGCDELFEAWSDPEATFKILTRLTRDRPCDITGIRGYAMLDDHGGIQWPFPSERADLSSDRRLFEDGLFFTDDKRAQFWFAQPAPLPERTSERYPLLLLTGRGSADQWHTLTRTNKSAVLRRMSPQEPYVEVSPVDARRLDIAPGELVRIESARAAIVARAFVTPTVRPGQVFVPMHYPEVNRLTFPSFDPHSRQPAYKASAVRLRRPHRWETA